MTPREIDAAIAEHVMGWWMGDERPVANYSTDPAASKALRDKMRADGWSYRIYVYASLCTAIAWKGISGKYAERKADTEEMAVALAALKALGVEVQA